MVMFFSTSEWFGVTLEIENKSCSPDEIYVGRIYKRKFSGIMHLLIKGILQERMYWANAIKDQEKQEQPFLASNYRDKTLTGFLQTSATWHAHVIASITAVRVPSLILHVFLVQTCFVNWELIQQVICIWKGFIHIMSDPKCLLRFKRIRFWWTKGLRCCVALPPDIFMICSNNKN